MMIQVRSEKSRKAIETSFRKWVAVVGGELSGESEGVDDGKAESIGEEAVGKAVGVWMERVWAGGRASMRRSGDERRGWLVVVELAVSRALRCSSFSCPCS